VLCKDMEHDLLEEAAVLCKDVVPDFPQTSYCSIVFEMSLA